MPAPCRSVRRPSWPPPPNTSTRPWKNYAGPARLERWLSHDKSRCTCAASSPTCHCPRSGRHSAVTTRRSCTPSARFCPRWQSDVRCSITSRNSPLASASGPSADSRRSRRNFFPKNFSHVCHTRHTQLLCAALCTTQSNSDVVSSVPCTATLPPQRLNTRRTVVNAVHPQAQHCLSCAKTPLSPGCTALITVTEISPLILL